MTINIVNTETEQLNFIRKSVTDPNSRTVNKVETLVSTAGQTIFSLTMPSGNHLQHVNSVKVNGVTNKWGRDYLGIFNGVNKDKIIFTTALTLSDVVIIDYNYGSKDIAYVEFARVDLPHSEYPRISVNFVYPTTIASASNYVTKTDIRMVCIIVAKSNYEATTIAQELRSAYINNKTNFHYVRYGVPNTVNSLNISEDATREVLAKVLEVSFPFIYEKN